MQIPSMGAVAVNVRKLIIGVYLCLFVVVGVMSAGFFWQTRRELEQLRGQEVRTRNRLSELQVRLSEQERILQRLREDPSYVERVIRRRLLYAKPDETVFRFED
ncbi:MAG TPA: septum formation initiator family protein [Opitutaceae bacterium]|nr:septum formation initiator family protein [Opitutaceae bacterium]